MFKAWLREPLTLFILLGVALFAADRAWNGAPAPIGENTHIVVTANQQATLRDAFRAENGRNPTSEELHARLSRWVEEEVLYREALSLNLDRKDLIVHRQLTQKMRFLLDDATALPTPTDAQLQAWLDQHMERYGKPQNISFDQVFLSRGQRGDHLLQDATAIGDKLAAHPQQFAGLGDPFPLGQHIDNADPMQLRREFGETFSEALKTLPQSTWSRPIVSGFGLHLVRVTGLHAPQPAALSEVRQRVLSDYQLAQHARMTQQAIEALKKKYRIEFEDLPA